MTKKFVTEARLHHKMDLKYEVRCFNKPIMICEYKPDGYTKNINKIFKQSPYGYFEYFKEIFHQDMHGVTLKKENVCVQALYLIFCANKPRTSDKTGRRTRKQSDGSTFILARQIGNKNKNIDFDNNKYVYYNIEI